MEILYTTKYKTKNQWFFRTIINVKGDLSIPETGNRVIILNDETRYEIPKDSIIIFSKERQLAIASNIKKETGQ